MISYSFYEADARVRCAAESLSERGDDVDVICLNKGNQSKQSYLNGVTIYRIKKRNLNEKRQIDYVLRLLSFFLLSTFFVTKFFFPKKYDVIHIHNVPDFLVFAAIIPKLFGSKTILDIHDIFPEFYAQKFNTSKDHILVRFLKLIERISTAYADHVIVSNGIWKNTLMTRSVPERKVTVILNTPDDSYFYPREKSKSNTGNFTLLYPGTLKEHFGVDIAIRAIDILRRHIPNIRYEIVGSGPLFHDLLKLVKELHLEKFVSFHKPVLIDEIPEFISQADIGIVPKRGGIFSDNALSGKLLEFVKMGVPAVVSRNPVEKMYFDEDMVMYFEPEDPNDLARCVMELYNNPHKRRALVRNTDRFNKKHNWEHYKKIYYRVIDNLCLKPDRKEVPRIGGERPGPRLW
jgi:glycosyltransferase involved in cell wall biosynthesis